MKARGELRNQYHHAIDLVPTILDVLGVEPPETIKGHAQSRLDGVSMRYSFDDAAAPTARTTQFYSMLGSRAVWHQGWKAVTTHPAISGWSSFNDDTWELYHPDVDRAELHDLAAEHPDKLRELVGLWFAEAGANQAFPLDDRSAQEILMTPRPQLSAPRSRYVYAPDTAEVPEAQAVNVRNRSYVVAAQVDLPAPGAHGVLFAHGSRFGGHALYVIPEGAGTVKSFDEVAVRQVLVDLASSFLVAGAKQPADGVVVERPQRSEDERPWGRQGLVAGWEEKGTGLLGRASFGRMSRGDAAPLPATAGWGQPGARVPVIGSPRQAAWSCAAAAGRAQSSGRPRRQAGVMTNASARPGCVRAVHIASLGAAARQRTWPSRRP